MIFKQRLFTALLGVLFASVLTDQASALYDPGVGRFCSRDPIGYMDGPNTYSYARINALTLQDFTGFLSTKAQGSQQIDLETAENTGCGECCCCPKSIKVTVGKNIPAGSTGVKGTPYKTLIEYTVEMEYKEIERTWYQYFTGYDYRCKVAFAEFPQLPPGTLSSYNDDNIWHDAVAEHDGGIIEEDFFKEWKDFNPNKQPCNGTASHKLRDKPQATFLVTDIMRFWQYVALLGGRDCKCKQPKIDILLAFHWAPPKDPKANVSPSPIPPGFRPQRPRPVPANLLPLPAVQ